MDNFDKIGEIIAQLSTEAPEDLSQRIFLAIEKRESRMAKIKIAIFGFISSVSFVLIYFAGTSAVANFYSSGTPQTFSLIFSDFQSVVANFGDYFISIGESFPIVPFVYALLSLVIFAVFTGLSLNNIQKFKELKTNLNYDYKHN